MQTSKHERSVLRGARARAARLRITRVVLSGAIAWTISSAALPLVTDATQAIDAAVAPLYVGQEVIVEGIVAAAERDGFIVRLRLGQPPQALTVQLVLGMLSRFPAHPEIHYLGKRVRVFGKITEFRGAAEIIVRDPDRIALYDDPASLDDAAALRERVEQLEQRLHEIERDAAATEE